jgi:drug/metabolite transporter (DMT)-like permease
VELGIALTLLATLGWGAGDVFARKAMFGASATTVLATMISLSVFALGITTVVLEGASAFRTLDLEFFALVTLMAALTWVTGNLLYFHGMQRAGITIAAPILGAAPLVGIALAVTIGGERPNAGVLFGGALIIGGIAILLTDRNRVIQ